MKYYIGLKICGYYMVHIIQDGIEDSVPVHEDNIDGFIDCLEYLGFEYKEI